MQFTKMHGCGNDYVYVDCFREKVTRPAKLAVRISDRHFGVGGDGLVLIQPSKKADFRMRMFNSFDGSEAEMCGNAIRCVAKYVYDRGMTREREITIETGDGVKTLSLAVRGGKVSRVRVDMGVPRLERAEIPMKGGAGRVINEPLKAAGRNWRVTCVSMGNPHCVIFVPDAEKIALEQIGPQIENHKTFPRRTNVEFAQIIGRSEIRMRVWERGSGVTLACGTGACGTLVAAALNGKADRKATVRLDGGDLQIRWADDDHVYMTGPAVEVFTGDFPA